MILNRDGYSKYHANPHGCNEFELVQRGSCTCSSPTLEAFNATEKRRWEDVKKAVLSGDASTTYFELVRFHLYLFTLLLTHRITKFAQNFQTPWV